MSTATLVELSFAGMRLREPIPLGRRFHVLPKIFRLEGLVTHRRHGKGIVVKETAMLRRVLFAKFSLWYPLNKTTARELRRDRLRRKNRSDAKNGQLFCQDVGSNELAKVPREVVPLSALRPSDDALQAALLFCVQNEYPTAGYGSALPRGVSHWDAETDSYISECIFCVPPKRSAAHATVRGSDFDSHKGRVPADYRAALRLALVDGWTYKDAAKRSGQNFIAFKRQAERLLKSMPSEAFVPKERRFQSENFARGFGEVGVRIFGSERVYTSEGVREVPYIDGEAVETDLYCLRERIFG